MGRGQVFKMYLFGKNRAKGKPEQNGCSYGPTPIRNLRLGTSPEPCQVVNKQQLGRRRRGAVIS
jgi:hypothetical protein